MSNLIVAGEFINDQVNGQDDKDIFRPRLIIKSRARWIEKNFFHACRQRVTWTDYVAGPPWNSRVCWFLFTHSQKVKFLWMCMWYPSSNQWRSSSCTTTPPFTNYSYADYFFFLNLTYFLALFPPKNHQLFSSSFFKNMSLRWRKNFIGVFTKSKFYHRLLLLQ